MNQFEIKDGVAIIPEGATKIEHGAFFGCTSLESIIIPESVTEVEKDAFSGYTSLKEIHGNREHLESIVPEQLHKFIVED